MSNTPLALQGYARVLVIDTQVVLEGKPLDELPWHEFEERGPILLLCVPRMLSEVDSKKRDGRLGERARRFNRLVDPAVGSATPITIVQGPVRVDLALAATKRVDWDVLADLDRDEGDDRIVAEALFSNVSEPKKLIIFSYDMRPRSAATRHGLGALKPPEDWLYEPEPSPQEKENLRLKQKVRELEATQPSISGNLAFESEMPCQLVRVVAPTDDFANSLEAEILSKNPQRVPRAYEMLRDYSYSSKYDEYERKVRRYCSNVHRSVERLFNQYSLILSFGVDGTIGASHIDVQLRTTNGRLHDKLSFKGVFQPSPPEYIPGILPYTGPNIADLMSKVPRHKVVFDPKPGHQSWIRLACEDFRHGRNFEQRIYLQLDPDGAQPCELTLSITAENFKGTYEQVLKIPFSVEEVRLEDLLDIGENRLLREYPLQRFIKELDEKTFDKAIEV